MSARARSSAIAPGPPDPVGDLRRAAGVDVLVATYNSATTLPAALASVRRYVPVHHLLVLDHCSTDGSAEIARAHGGHVEQERVGLGYARNRALDLADTEVVLFLDGDVELVRPDFFVEAWRALLRPRTAAAVGMAVGHTYRYGLPLGLTLLRRGWAMRAGIPDSAQGRETYYLQRLARRERLRVRYVPEAMVHHGTYRRLPRWPEFQGAAIRRSSGGDPRELAYALVVILLMHMNSRRPRHVAYTPIFFAKLLRGFLDPSRWGRLDRSGTISPPSPMAP